MLQLMREWLLDCFDHDDASVLDIETCTPEQIRRAVARLYDGGLSQFEIDHPA